MMEQHKIEKEMLEKFKKHLRREERAMPTIQKYLHDVNQFQVWLGGKNVTKERVTEWKEHLLMEQH